MKRSYKTKNNKKAFTLIELLIVIAIIGILFIVLVSKVDFATDKAKATGVQTDFRSFQMAFDQVAKENAGFNIFGWDTGDANGDRIRNSYDRGDTNKNGKEDPGETFIGRKTYGEDWTTIYTMINPDTTKPNDTSAFVALEQAINANLDPKLHITITPDVDGGALTGNATVTMANQARDPWKNEYHGVFITNADEDGKDRGAIIIYSNGANGEWGSDHDIANGLVRITVPGNNKLGQDDMSIVSCYTYVNGYGEVLNMTTGFSNNQTFLAGGNNDESNIVTPHEPINYTMLNGANTVVTEVTDVVFRSEADFNKFIGVKINGTPLDSSNYIVTEGSTIVTLKSSYIETLNNANYTIEIVSRDGFASCNFTIDVAEVPVLREGYLSGIWVFNKEIYPVGNMSVGYKLEQAVMFEYEGKMYSKMVFTIRDENWWYIQADLADSPGHLPTIFENDEGYHGWPGDFADEDDFTVNFGAESQMVSKEFYAWFTANATRVE